MKGWGRDAPRKQSVTPLFQSRQWIVSSAFTLQCPEPLCYISAGLEPSPDPLYKRVGRTEWRSLGRECSTTITTCTA